ncbi:peroxiredoxin-like family protein [Methylomonas sp. AM2-LC]|uniref:peroxiredoxin-like family protein n=1 Tax=Methylomonas sp. AM2-LC TaxID=3153301 RepID=UPI003263733D
MKVKVGEKITPFSLETIAGESQTVPDPSRKLTHLQFRRFAGCPICNFHLHTFSQKADDLEAAGIMEVIMFHSSVEEMRKYQNDLPFATVADPKKKYYKQFGVETSWFASLHPKALWAAVKGILIGKMGLKMENGPLGLPADILLDRLGTVVAVKYGSHAYDQWEVSELLENAK